MSKIRLIAFYLPQFHPIPENDEWWGKGFTEWTNVTKAKPLFPGHYQPHLPTDLGFYDLRLPEAREAQAELARAYGIHGFCYYHYWFNGRRIIERPFNDVLASGKPDFPFCLCWANEDWTRSWDGLSKDILLGQTYGDEDDRKHIQALIPAFRDSRYIRIDGRPFILIYRTDNHPNPSRLSEIWREECLRAGIGDIYLARVEGFVGGIDPKTIGFDAAVEFAPDWRNLGALMHRSQTREILTKLGLLPDSYYKHNVCRYDGVIHEMLAKPASPYVQFRCVTPGFDNSARRAQKDAAIIVGSTPEKFQGWLQSVLAETAVRRSGDERIVFINAWNEWAEGNHLEPDTRWGHGFLAATRAALDSFQAQPTEPRANGDAYGTAAVAQASPNFLKRYYWDIRRKGRSFFGSLPVLLRDIRFHLGRKFFSAGEE